MFYYLIALILAYHWILILATVIPAFFLMVKITRTDRLEPESPAILGRMAVAGVLSSLLSLVAEFIGELIVNVSLQPDNTLYNAILYFGVVGLSEEGAKYILLKNRSWKAGNLTACTTG